MLSSGMRANVRILGSLGFHRRQYNQEFIPKIVDTTCSNTVSSCVTNSRNNIRYDNMCIREEWR